MSDLSSTILLTSCIENFLNISGAKSLNTGSGVYLASFLCLVVCLLFSVMHIWPVSAYLWFKERFNTWPPFMWIYGIRKIMKFALGMVGNMLFQYFFRFASPQLLAVFLCFAVAWLGNVAMIQPLPDFGIFNFLLMLVWAFQSMSSISV